MGRADMCVIHDDCDECERDNSDDSDCCDQPLQPHGDGAKVTGSVAGHALCDGSERGGHGQGSGGAMCRGSRGMRVKLNSRLTLNEHDCNAQHDDARATR